MRKSSTSCFVLLCASLALPACTLLNAPDALPPFPVDGGGVESDGGGSEDASSDDMTLDEDGGVDAGVDVGCRSREICFNGSDDDCDDAIDCDDLDCASNAACCTAGDPRIDEMWTASGFALRWKSEPESALGNFTADAALSFGADGRLRSLVRRGDFPGCLPLVFGARIEFEYALGACVDADAGACDGEAAVLLTGADGAAMGAPLAADLRVAVNRDALLSVTSGTTSLPGSPQALGGLRRVVIEISPTAQDGVPVLAARVFAPGVSSDLDVVVASNVPFLPQSALRACPVDATLAATLGGLRIAVEGRGSAVTLGRLQVTPLACTNPVVFTSAVSSITAASLPAASGWNAGGIGAPALLPQTGAQHLFYDATNVDRDLESVAPIDFAIGAADAESVTSASWQSRPSTAPGVAAPAYVGSTPPACTTPPCPPSTSFREPTASAAWDPSGQLGGTSYLLAFARETDGGAFEVAYVNAPIPAEESPGASPTTRTLVAPGGTCTSVRDPAFAQAERGQGEGLWLFYTCERADLPSTIRAVPLALRSGAWVVVPGADVEVLGPSIGAYAARGVRGAAPLVRVLPDPAPGSMGGTLAVRLWFAARGADGRATLGLAEGQRRLVVRGAAPSEMLPALVPSPANPLLDGTSAALGGCVGSCALEDVAVGRIPGAGATQVTLLVARRVDEPSGGTLRQFIPLEQTLEPRWWGNP